MSECYVKQVSFKKLFESIGVSSELDVDDERSCSTPGPVSTGMGDPSRVYHLGI